MNSGIWMISMEFFSQISRIDELFPSPFRPKLWLGPITMAFMPIFSMRSSKNWGKGVCANWGVKWRMMICSIPSFSISSMLSSGVLMRKKSRSGCSTCCGWGWKVMTTLSPSYRAAVSFTKERIFLCPRCTPSNAPTAMTALRMSGRLSMPLCIILLIRCSPRVA